MAVIEWSDELSVGIGNIDEQHDQLFKLMAELDSAIREHKATEKIEDILTMLFNYAQIHFATEEELLMKHKYPEIKLHELEHQMFIAKAFGFKEKFEDNPNRPGLSLEILDFLFTWILNHIQLTDKRYSGYLNKCGVL